ncbi:MAG: DNA-3-methyladenine glycosylase 2 family protein, partial [Pseudomonadota bacterium]
GLSGPKSRYVEALARALEDGSLDLAALAGAGDVEAMDTIQSVKGLGPWSAAIYLLFCEGRVDIWPPGDVALMTAYQAAADLEKRPPAKEFDPLAEAWRPYRGVAAHILWTYYAHLKRRKPI